VSGCAENSIRVNGTAQSHVANVIFKNVSVVFDRWTKYTGGVYDNRPTKVLTPVEPHETDGFNLQYVDQVVLNNCAVHASGKKTLHFLDSISATDVNGLEISNFKGNSPAHPIFVK
jgi:hypothetical protein